MCSLDKVGWWFCGRDWYVGPLSWVVMVLGSSRLHVAPSKARAYEKHDRRADLGELGGLEVLRGVLNPGVAEEARTRGFATPAFAGCAFIGL
jgi:hypothetical protein